MASLFDRSDIKNEDFSSPGRVKVRIGGRKNQEYTLTNDAAAAERFSVSQYHKVAVGDMRGEKLLKKKKLYMEVSLNGISVKTQLKTGTNFPIWSETFIFDVLTQDIPKMNVVIKIKRRHTIKWDDLLGQDTIALADVLLCENGRYHFSCNIKEAGVFYSAISIYPASQSDDNFDLLHGHKFWSPPKPNKNESDFVGAKVGPELEYVITGWLPAGGCGSSGFVWKGKGPEGSVVIKTANNAESTMWAKELRGAHFCQEIKHENLMEVSYIGEQACPIDSPNGPLGKHGEWMSFIVIEKCLSLDMFSFVEKKAMSQQLCRHYFVQLAKGIHALHSSGGAHRDLKPDNLLLDRNMTLKIGDFGFARAVGDAQEYTLGTGTRFYNSPEMSAQEGVERRSDVSPFAQDIWMMGCCLFVMLTNNFPFVGDQPPEYFYSTLDSADSPDLPTHDGYWKGKFLLRCRKRPAELMKDYLLTPGHHAGDKILIDLFNRMWDKNWKRRITVKQILTHPWCATNKDGSAYVQENMKEQVQEFLRTRTFPSPDSLLGEMLTAIPGTNVAQILMKENQAEN